MTNLQKAMVVDIKEYIKNDIAETKQGDTSYFEQFLKGFKFISVEHKTIDNNELAVECYPDGKILICYRVKTRFKPVDKYGDNVAMWEYNVYSDGTTSVHFDGVEHI